MRLERDGCFLARRSAEVCDRIREFRLDALLLLGAFMAVLMTVLPAVRAGISALALAAAPVAATAAPSATAPPAGIAAIAWLTWHARVTFLSVLSLGVRAFAVFGAFVVAFMRCRLRRSGLRLEAALARLAAAIPRASFAASASTPAAATASAPLSVLALRLR